MQRHDPTSAIPAMVVFDRYAFDLSQFAGGAQAVKYSIRERYLWQLISPDAGDQFFVEQPGQFRAELHDRLIAPLYPIAFVVIAFAYLGAPRTNRQSRTVSMVGAIGGVALLRLIGFASTVFGANIPWLLSLQYVAMIVACGGGLYVIRARPDPGAAGLRRQLAHRAHRAHRASASPRHELTMPMVGGTLARYFGLRFLSAVLLVFVGIFALVALLDYIELMRRSSDIPHVSALLVAKTSFYRVPQVTERIMPFCVLIGAMSCYLNLSRRLELVVARSAGMSAWQFIAPALIVAFLLGVFATAVYNPVSAILQERSKRYEAELFGQNPSGCCSGGRLLGEPAQRATGRPSSTPRSSRDQGVKLNGVTVFTFDNAGHFKQRIEARAAVLEPGVWRLLDARVYELGVLPVDHAEYPAQDQPDAGTSSRKFCDARNRAILGTSAVYQDRGTRRTCRRRL